jgi:hypothetical protein
MGLEYVPASEPQHITLKQLLVVADVRQLVDRFRAKREHLQIFSGRLS